MIFAVAMYMVKGYTCIVYHDFKKNAIALCYYSYIKRRNMAYNCAFMNIKNFRYYNKKIGSTKGDDLLKMYAAKVNDFLLPDEVVEKTVDKYKEAYELLSGEKF